MLPQCVEESDVIFAASGSEELLVHKEDIENMPAASDKVRRDAEMWNTDLAERDAWWG